MKEISQSNKDQLDNSGYVIIPNVLSVEECERYKTLMSEKELKYSHLYAQSESAKKFHGASKSNIKIVYNLYNKDRFFLNTIDHEKVLPYVAYLLQNGSYMNQEPYALQLSTGRGVGPGSKAQQLHIDSNVPGCQYALVAQALWMLDDFTIENGATKLVPGSQKYATFAEDDKRYPEEIDAVGEAGSVLVYNGGVWHGSGENNSDKERWAMINTYSRWFIKPAFDTNKNMPRDIYHQLTNTQKELLGFKFNPPKDEFTRLSRRSEDFEEPDDYKLLE